MGPCNLPDILTGELYADFLENEVVPLLNDLEYDSHDITLQQDGAPAHTAHVARDVVDEWFGGLIGIGGFLEWPARSPDLNPLDYFLWGFIKTFVYDQNPPESLEELQQKFEEAVAALTPEMIRRATHEQFIRRLEACIEADGGHFEHLL